MRSGRLAALALGAGALVLALAAIFDIGVADARPGGGQGYSGGGGGGGSSGGGGGGGGELVYLLVRLIIVYPQVGIPLAVVCVGGAVYFRRQHKQTGASDWDSVDIVDFEPPANLGRIRALDDNFSPVLFEDFLYRLYATVHKRRAVPGGLDSLSPYFGDGPRLTLSRHEPVGAVVDNVIVGSMRLTNLVVPPAASGPNGEPYFTKLDVTFESNMTTVADNRKKSTTLYAKERWRLARAGAAQSKEPGATRDFPCPNCGAKFEAGDQGQCSYCDQPVGTGAFDWLVYQIDSLELKEKPPMLRKTVAEVGTNDATVVDPVAASMMAAIHEDDAHFTHEALDARLRLLYHELNVAWTACDLMPVRGFVSDGMFDYLDYWVRAYLRQGLRNELREMEITHWAIAKATRDKFYDAVTLRIWGNGFDTTVDAKTGKLVTGSKRNKRAYSEYWTLIRSATRRGPVRSDKNCPNCGAGLQISMAGTCDFCSAHITSGEFDWVLSKIEQDESYRG